MPKKSTEEKIEYPTPLLSHVEAHETNSAPENAEPLFLVCARRLAEAPSRFQKGVLVYVNNSAVQVGYASAAPGQVFTEGQMVIKTDDEDLLKERKAAAAETVARLLRERAIIDIGKVEAWGSARWEAHLSDEGRKIIEDIEAYLLAQVKTVEGSKPGEELADGAEEVYLVAKSASLPVPGRRDSPLVYPSLVAESIFDMGYRPDAARRAEDIARLIEAGTIRKAGRVERVTEETVNILTGKNTRFSIVLEKPIRAELEALAEADYWKRLANWKARGRPGYEPTRL